MMSRRAKASAPARQFGSLICKRTLAQGNDVEIKIVTRNRHYGGCAWRPISLSLGGRKFGAESYTNRAMLRHGEKKEEREWRDKVGEGKLEE